MNIKKKSFTFCIRIAEIAVESIHKTQLEDCVYTKCCSKPYVIGRLLQTETKLCLFLLPLTNQALYYNPFLMERISHSVWYNFEGQRLQCVNKIYVHECRKKGRRSWDAIFCIISSWSALFDNDIGSITTYILETHGYHLCNDVTYAIGTHLIFLTMHAASI